MSYRFAEFILDPDQQELRRGQEVRAIPPRAFAVLHHLIVNHDRMVAKSELLETFWTAQASEASLLNAISQIRKALDARSELVRTYHGRGFRFIGEVHAPAAPALLTAHTAIGEQRFVTVLGVQGAHPDSDAAPQIVTRHGGTVLGASDTGFTAAFGLLGTYEDGARRALYAASELREAGLEDAQFALETGPASHDAERPLHLEQAVASRAHAAAPGDILLSAASQTQLRDEVDTEAQGDSFRLLRLLPRRAGIPTRPQRHPTPFVGRQIEQALLAEAANRAQSGMGQALILSGPAGIGKSRLVAEFIRDINAQTHQIQTLFCLPGRANTPGAVIRDLCQSLPGTDLGADPRATELWADLTSETGKRSAALAGLSDRERQTRALGVLEHVMRAQTATRALVLVIEDIHWIDATSRSDLARVIARLDEMAVIVVMTTRPRDGVPLADTVLQVSPLSRGDSLDVLRANPDLCALAPDVQDTLVQRAAGNPFFLEELALAAQAGADPEKGLPDTVQAAISVRIAALNATRRALVYVIAVIGPAASSDLIRHVLGWDAKTLEADLNALVVMGFLVPDGDGHSFRHMLINDAAYAMIARADRTALHHAIAVYLQDTGGRPETLAWHYQHAGQIPEALHNWTAACRAAINRAAAAEAESFARSGLALITPDLPEAGKAELALQLLHAFVLTNLRGYGADAVGMAYLRARDLNRVIGQADASVQVSVGLWVHTWVRGELDASLRHARDLLRMADHAGHDALNMQAHASMGEVLVHTGALREGLSHLRAGMARFGPEVPGSLPAQNSAVACIAYAAWVSSLMGDTVAAARYRVECAQMSTRLDNPFATALNFALCSESLMIEGDVAGCLAFADKAIAVSRTHDYAFWLGTGLVMRGWALGLSGESAEAEAAMHEGLTVFEATGAGVQLANWYGLKAEMLLAAGQNAAATEAADHALDHAIRCNDMWFAPRIHAVAACAYTRLDQPERAAKHRTQAQALAAEFEMSEQFLTPLPQGAPR